MAATGNRMDTLIEDIKWQQRDKFKYEYKKTFMKTLGDLNEAEKARLDDVIITMIRKGNRTVIETIGIPIFDKRKLIDWKNKSDLIITMVDGMLQISKEKMHSEERFPFLYFGEKFMETLDGYQLLEKHAKNLYEVVRESFTTFKHPNAPIHGTAEPFIKYFPWSGHPDLVVEITKLIKVLVRCNSDVDGRSGIGGNLRYAYEAMFRKQSGKNAHLRALDDAADIFNFCAQQDFQWSEDPTEKTISYVLLDVTMQDFLDRGYTSPELIKPMIASIYELRECGDTALQSNADYIVSAVADHPDLVGDQTGVLLKQFLQGKLPTLSNKFVEMYKNEPEAFHPFLPRLLDMTNSEVQNKMLLVQLFTEVAKRKHEKLPKESIPSMVKLLKDISCIHQALLFLDAVAVKQPKSVIPYDKQIIESMDFWEYAKTIVADVLAKLCIDQAGQRKYLKAIADQVENNTSGPHQVALINTMRTIGVNCPAILGEHRKLFEKLRNRADLKDMCQSAIDIIEGRNLGNVAGEVSEQRKDINQLDSRVTETEDNVGQISKDVTKNKSDIKQVKGTVAKQGQKLDDLKIVVDETVEKVEVIDHKTLSHAPAWCVDVAKMLNPKADHDWRLLARRLGYSTDDIRNWATQPNPCLSMFDEWFATHKTREATYGILKTLVEMDRTDASVIVDKALKSVEYVVEDEYVEPDVPPPVFLSYQWAHQPEVKLLKKHLGMAGYSSWMDIGQMGGGDKLFAKIDKGIRAAKVIVCCVTERYAESPNCNREVNLSVTLGKPVIPLLMEKMSWPPPGSMGPIFGEYIFVRFFQRPEEKTGDDRYWASDKFTELLMQLRYNIAPDNSLILKESPYKNWWQPPEEVIVIKPKPKTPSSLPSIEKPDTKKSAFSPDIFLSYQWDKQPQIKALYRRLLQLGYTCWLDIMQMGGGDSLYDKIDRGIRGCKVIVSCVTSKYALSANCRREVSLGDGIKKPIIPLLLEKSTWPPEGPMGMVFTQLLYIDFCKPNEDIQKDWKCPQFDELIKKIEKVLLPNTEATPATTSTARRPLDVKGETSTRIPSKPAESTRQDSTHETSAWSQSAWSQSAWSQSAWDQVSPGTAKPPGKNPERTGTLGTPAKTSYKPTTSVQTETKAETSAPAVPKPGTLAQTEKKTNTENGDLTSGRSHDVNKNISTDQELTREKSSKSDKSNESSCCAVC